MSHHVKVDKYEFILHDGWDLEILRGGARWMSGDMTGPGSKAIHAMMCELDAARVVVAADRDLVGAIGERSNGPIGEALRLHDALVGEGGAPSDWTKT